MFASASRSPLRFDVAASSVTVQLRGNDAAQCFGITLSDFKAQDADFVKVK